MTRKSSKSGKSSRQKLSNDDIGNSESQMEPVLEQLAQGGQQAPQEPDEADAESDAEPEPEAPTLTELIINKYVGDRVNNQFEGFGFMEFANGNLYEGNFYHGTMHGKGRYTWTATGMLYEGEFYCNQINGIGKYTWPDGSSYEGQVAQGVRHGVGVYTHPSGLCYDGQWDLGQKQGQGKLTYNASGTSYYEGQWLADKPHGKGVRRYPSGNAYQGMWYAGLRHGQGCMRWADKDETYTGQWEDGIQHGFGQHTWYLKRAPGSQYMLRNIYEGDFVKGRRHGYGVFYYPSGSRYEGQWADDVKCGQGKFIFKNGRVFEGQFKDDRMVEFPNFTHDGRTTPDHASVRTRSPMPGETRSVHSNASVNTLSPGFQLSLDHIIVGANLFDDCDLAEETAQTSFVAINFLGKLRKVYNYYATLGTSEIEDNANVLTMLQFWRLIKDCRFINEDWTLAKFNRMLISSYESTTPETAHDPRREVVFLDFLNHLVVIAFHLYSPTIKAEKGLLAACFRKLIQDKVLPHACSVRGPVFQDAAQGRYAVAQFTKPLWPVFQQQCQCERRLKQQLAQQKRRQQRQSLMQTEWVITVRQFLRMLSQFNLLDEQRLTTARVVEILSRDDEFISDGQFLLLDREMTFLEFFEGLVGCATVAVVVSGPGAAAAAVMAAAATAGASADLPAAADAGASAAAAAAAAAAGVQSSAASEPPQLPDETYLLAPAEPSTEAASEAGDQPSGGAAGADGGAAIGANAVGGETSKSPVDPQHHKSKVSESARADKGGGGGSGSGAAGDSKKSGGGGGASSSGAAGASGASGGAGGAATGRGGAKGPQQQQQAHGDGKHTARDTAAGAKDARQPPSRSSRDQDKKSDAGGGGGGGVAGGRKSLKSVGGAATLAAANAAAAASGADGADASREDAGAANDDDESARGGDEAAASRDALRVTSEVDANQDELELLLDDEAASLTAPEKKALVARRRLERWQQQLRVFLAEWLARAAELQALIGQRLEQRRQEELLEMQQTQQQRPQAGLARASQSGAGGGTGGGGGGGGGDLSQLLDGGGTTTEAGGGHTEDNQSDVVTDADSQDEKEE